jgi:trans-aconitate methyltransferase
MYYSEVFDVQRSHTGLLSHPCGGVLCRDPYCRHELFVCHVLPRLPATALILDAGCGSGRDSNAFLAKGHRLVAFDACEALVHMARQQPGLAVAHQDFADVSEKAHYDGILACASLLHVREKALPDRLKRLWEALRPGGVLYMSFKYGDHERMDQQGRHFTDATPARLTQWTSAFPAVASTDTWITEDLRPDRGEHWLNAIFQKAMS